MELGRGAEDARVDKVEQTKVLGEVVLDGRAAQDDAPRRLELVQRLERLALRVFQPVALAMGRQTHAPTGAGVSVCVRAAASGRPCCAYFIAEDQADGLALEDVGVDAERLVRDDQDLGRAVLVVVRVRAGQAPAQPRLVRLDADECLQIERNRRVRRGGKRTRQQGALAPGGAR